MEKSLIEMPQVDIPDEFTQVELPEIGETTPHPDPTSPQVHNLPDQTGKIGFVKD